MKKTVISIFFSVIIIATSLFFAFECILTYNSGITNDTGPLIYLSVFYSIFFAIIIISAEIDIFHNVLYFASDKSKRKNYKTIFNIIACVISCVIIATAIMNLFYYHRKVQEIILLAMIGVYLLVRMIYLAVNLHYKDSVSK